MEIYFLTVVLTYQLSLTYCDARGSIQYDHPDEKSAEIISANDDEILDVAENVVFRPYFNHNTHHGHGVASPYLGVSHHKHPNVALHPYHVPLAQEKVSLQNVDQGSIIDPKLQSNLIRRSYASTSGGSPVNTHIYHAPVSASSPSGQYYYYATNNPVGSANGLPYGQRPIDTSKGSVPLPMSPSQNVKPALSSNSYATKHSTGAGPQNCYCLPANMPSHVVHHKPSPVDSYYQDYVKEVIAYYNNYYNQYGKT